QKKDKKDRF
uniref:Tachykinin-like peptide-V n=1 Tax=Phoneutria nigriventer TaxID=6918 RepID=TLP5_PHONI|nr:RecName: Full=Tachykinin-like peptide-V; AltName: Full=P.nigriventer tachykinin peptides V; Short=PnTkP-V; AltName: Full=U29-ctenitoxin-Pn1e; Short=U29-CNTX-Pn1e [Phoneutria nigriventer]